MVNDPCYIMMAECLNTYPQVSHALRAAGDLGRGAGYTVGQMVKTAVVFGINKGTAYRQLNVPVDIKRQEVQQRINALLDKHGWGAKLHDWTITTSPVDKGQGWCRYATKHISIPVWVFDECRGEGYGEYYLLHEIAHALAGHEANHGPVFMAKLIEICPPELVHYELGYKPGLAAAAGIKKPSAI